jgi:hypothetical protein
MKIAFVNSHEEGKKGAMQGKTSNFNQFSAVDLSLANSIQSYINYLQYIEQQIYTVSGITPQRLGSINNSELVGNTERAVNQSSLITEYLFTAHNEVIRRVYESLIEVAKIAYKDGNVQQYVADDMAIEVLNMEEFEFENSEFSVFMTNSAKDKVILSKLEQLAQTAMQQQKVDLSTIIDTILNDSPKDIIATLRRSEESFYQRQQDKSKSEQDHQTQMAQMQQQHEQELRAYTSDEKQKDRDLEQFVADEANRTRVEVAEIAAYGFAKAPVEDIAGATDAALKQQALESKSFTEQQKIAHAKQKHADEHNIKQKALSLKEQELKIKKQETDTRAKAEIKKVNVQKQISKDDNATKIKVAKMKPKNSK